MAMLLGLRTYLLGLIIVAIVPVLAFAGVVLWSAGSDQMRRREADLASAAQVAAAAVDRELAGMLALLQGLAQSPALQDGDLEEFYRHARQAAEPRGTVMSLQTLDGSQLVNTRVPFGQRLPPGGNADARARVIASGQATISDLYIGAVSRRAQIAAAVPAFDRQGNRFMLDMPMEPAALAALLQRFLVGPTDVAAIADAEARIIARSSDQDDWLGRALPRWLVLVARPAALVDDAFFQPLTRLATMGGAILLVALSLAALLSHVILKPVLQLTREAGSLAAGESAFADAPSEIREIRALAAATAAAHKAQLQRARTERDEALAAGRAAALADANAMFRAFAETTPDVVWIIDLATGRLEYLSPAYEAIWGEGRDAAVADVARWSAGVHPEDRAGFAAMLEAVARGQTHDFEYRVVRPDGAVRWIRDLAFPLHDATGAVTRAAGLARDVTQRKEVEGRLRTSDTRCTGLIDALEGLSWFSTADGRIVEQRGAPVEAGQLQRTPDGGDWLSLVPEADRQRLDSVWSAARAAGKAWQIDLDIVWPGLPPRRHRCRAAPVRNDAGDVVEWAGVLLDLEGTPSERPAA
jgi:PAS domain S-box-containing protein